MASVCRACACPWAHAPHIPLAGLVEHGVADAELARVVQQCASPEPAPARRRRPQHAGHVVDVQRHALAVAAGKRALGVDHRAEGGGNVVQVIVVQRHLQPHRFQRQHGLVERGRVEQGPERGLLGHAFEGLHQRRVEPAAGAAALLVQRGLRVAGGEEDVHHLGQQRNARRQRSGLAGQPVRPAAAVPVSIQAANAHRHRVREAQPARNVGPALAARLGQFVRDLRAVAHDVEHRAQPLRDAHSQSGVRETKCSICGRLKPTVLKSCLNCKVVGQVELADARGVAAAAQVLEQQGVVQRPQVLLAQADGLADMHAEPAAARAMTLGLPFGDGQCMTERADQLRQAQRTNWRGGKRPGCSAGIESFHVPAFGSPARDLEPVRAARAETRQRLVGGNMTIKFLMNTNQFKNSLRQ